MTEHTSREPDWRKLAIHALSDLRILGVDITEVTTSPEVIAAVDLYDRDSTAYS